MLDFARTDDEGNRSFDESLFLSVSTNNFPLEDWQVDSGYPSFNLLGNTTKVVRNFLGAEVTQSGCLIKSYLPFQISVNAAFDLQDSISYLNNNFCDQHILLLHKVQWVKCDSHFSAQPFTSDVTEIMKWVHIKCFFISFSSQTTRHLLKLPDGINFL